MTNQSQPLTLKLSNGQEVSIAQAKSVLRHTENGQQHSCAIVRGPEGAAIYNAKGDVEINGAPSSAHWLQPGDTLQFSNSLSASVEQLGVASQALDSLLNEPQPAAPEQTQANSAQLPVQLHPARIATVEPSPTTSEVDQNAFAPATAAASYLPEAQPAQPPQPQAAPPVSADTTPNSATVSDLVIPAATAATLAALGVASVSAEPPVEPVTTPAEPAGFTPVISEPAVVAPTAEPETDPAPPSTGFAAELLAQIQADDGIDQQNENANETVGTPDSETTHSPLAADGHSFSSPAVEETSDASISSLIPELPSASAFAQAQAQNEQPESPQVAPSAPVETSTAQSAERQTQTSSVSALLERMKTEGQWGGLSEEAAEEAASTATPETNETPILDETDEDVQSYMSQLLSRMRDPNEAQQQQPAATASPVEVEAKPEVVEAPKPVGLLKPEEYIPKSKAKPLASLREMRALANTQTRTAIDRSQAKRLEESVGLYNMTIGVGSCVAAAIVFALNFCGYLSLPIALGIAAMIVTAGVMLFLGKTFLCNLFKSNETIAAAPQTPHEV